MVFGEFGPIIEAVKDSWGFLALGVLVLGVLAVKMTDGVRPEIRAGIFVFIFLSFALLVTALALPNPSEGSQESQASRPEVDPIDNGAPEPNPEQTESSDLVSAAPSNLDSPPQLEEYAQAVVSLYGSEGRFDYRVWVAETDQQQAVGLRFLPRLLVGQGMIFPSETPIARSFWMRDSGNSLDWIFIDERGRVNLIHERAEPFSSDSILSDGPVIAVLGLGAGEVERTGLRVGDVIASSVLE